MLVSILEAAYAHILRLHFQSRGWQVGEVASFYNSQTETITLEATVKPPQALDFILCNVEIK